MILFSCLSFSQAAQATFLQGYLQRSDIAKLSGKLERATHPASSGVAPLATAPAKIRPSVLAPRYLALLLRPNSYPRIYEGCWQCISTVTSSSTQTIEVGTQIVCDVTFFRMADQGTWAHFIQAGWSETKVVVISANQSEAQVERTDNYQCANSTEIWEARSQDHFRLVNPTSIAVNSRIVQIHNGSFVGSYQTYSILSKRTTR